MQVGLCIHAGAQLRLKLCQLLGQLGVFLTFAAATVRRNSEERDKREREREEREERQSEREKTRKSKTCNRRPREERPRRAREVWRERTEVEDGEGEGIL